MLGLGAAAIFPLSLAVIPVLFAPEERQKAIALMASATFISFPIGPIVGGYLLDHFWWGSVFLINVPVVALALIAVAVLLPESAGRSGSGSALISAMRQVGATIGVAVLGTVLASVYRSHLVVTGLPAAAAAAAKSSVVAGVAVAHALGSAALLDSARYAFFRYFPTKEDIVLRDDMDTRMIEALERQPASLGPLSAVRAALREVYTSYTQHIDQALALLEAGLPL